MRDSVRARDKSEARTADRGASTRKAADTSTARLPKTGGYLPGDVTDEERHAMIAEAAYYRAERRSFSGEDSLADWLAAEAEVDARLARQGKRQGKL